MRDEFSKKLAALTASMRAEIQKLKAEAKGLDSSFGQAGGGANQYRSSLDRANVSQGNWERGAKNISNLTKDLVQKFRPVTRELGNVANAFRASDRDMQKFANGGTRLERAMFRAGSAARGMSRALFDTQRGVRDMDFATRQAEKGLFNFGYNAARAGDNFVKSFTRMNTVAALLAPLIFTLLQSILSLAASLVSVAAAATMAAAAIGGALVAGVMQAIPVVGLLALAFHRLQAVMTLATLSDKAAAKTAVNTAHQHKLIADQTLKNTRALIDIQNKKVDAILAEKDANLSLLEAKQRLLDQEKAAMDAKRQLSDLQGALGEAKQNLAAAIKAGDANATAEAQNQVASAQQQLNTAQSSIASQNNDLALRRAKLTVQEAEQKKVEATLAAKRAVEDAARAKARGYVTAPAKTPASLAAKYQVPVQVSVLTQNLDAVEKRMIGFIRTFKSLWIKAWQPMTDTILLAVKDGLVKVEGLLNDKTFMKAFQGLADAIGNNIRGLAKFFTSPEQKKFFEQFVNLATKNMPVILKIFEMVFTLMEKIGLAFAPVLKDILSGTSKSLQGWVKGMDKPAAAPKGFEQNKAGAFAAKSESYLTSIGHFFTALLHFLGALISVAAGPGKNALDELAKTFNRWAKELETTHKKGAREFFSNAIRVTGQLLDFFGKILAIFFKIASDKGFENFLKTLEKIALPALGNIATVYTALFNAIAGAAKNPFIGKLLELFLTIYGISKLTPIGAAATALFRGIVLLLLRQIAFNTGGGIGGWVGKVFSKVPGLKKLAEKEGVTVAEKAGGAAGAAGAARTIGRRGTSTPVGGAASTAEKSLLKKLIGKFGGFIDAVLGGSAIGAGFAIVKKGLGPVMDVFKGFGGKIGMFTRGPLAALSSRFSGLAGGVLTRLATALSAAAIGLGLEGGLLGATVALLAPLALLAAAIGVVILAVKYGASAKGWAEKNIPGLKAIDDWGNKHIPGANWLDKRGVKVVERPFGMPGGALPTTGGGSLPFYTTNQGKELENKIAKEKPGTAVWRSDVKKLIAELSLSLKTLKAIAEDPMYKKQRKTIEAKITQIEAYLAKLHKAFRAPASHAAGGTVAGAAGAAVPIIAHAGEWVVNDGQQHRLARAMARPVKAVRDFLFGGRMPKSEHYMRGGVVGETSAKAGKLFTLPGHHEGLVKRGNLDLNHRMVAHNSDGSISTERSISIGVGRNEVLIPTVIEGKVVSKPDSIEHYQRTRENLGTFTSPATSNRYAEELHRRQDNYYKKDRIDESGRHSALLKLIDDSAGGRKGIKEIALALEKLKPTPAERNWIEGAHSWVDPARANAPRVEPISGPVRADSERELQKRQAEVISGAAMKALSVNIARSSGHAPASFLFEPVQEAIVALALKVWAGNKAQIIYETKRNIRTQLTFAGADFSVAKWFADAQLALHPHGRGPIKGYDTGGAIEGKGQGSAVPIIAHVGEWVVNKAQQHKLSAALGKPIGLIRDLLFGKSTGETKEEHTQRRHKAKKAMAKVPGLNSGVDEYGNAWYGFSPGIDDWTGQDGSIPVTTAPGGAVIQNSNPIFIETPLGQYVNLARKDLAKVIQGKGFWLPNYVTKAHGFVDAGKSKINSWKRSHVARGLGLGEVSGDGGLGRFETQGINSAVNTIMKSPLWSYGSGGVVGWRPSQVSVPSFAAGGVVTVPATMRGKTKAAVGATQQFEIHTSAPDIDIDYIMRIAKIHADTGS